MSRCDYDELYRIKNAIDDLNKLHHVELLHIFMKNKCEMSENQNGTFLNMTKISREVISEVKDYLEYVEFQNESLKEIENKKKNLVKKYFNEEQHGAVSGGGSGGSQHGLGLGLG